MRKPWIIYGFAVALFASLPALATTEQRVENFIIDVGKHPTEHRHAFVVSNDSDGDVHLCFGYANDFKKGNTGSFRAKATITRFDPETGESADEGFAKRGDLKSNKWLRCIQTSQVLQGDTVVVNYTLTGLPRLRGGTVHIKTGLGRERMLVTELRGREAQSDPGDPTQIHHRSRGIFAEAGKHKPSWHQGWIVPKDSVGDVQFCFGYGNNFKKGDTGSITGTAEITRTDPETGEASVQTITKSGDLKSNRFKKCREIDPVRAGDSVVAEMLLSELLAPPSETGGGGSGEDGGGGGGGGGENPPTNTGEVSAADQQAISAMSKMTAISVGNRVRGGRTFLIGHRYNCANLLEAPTIAAVYEKFVRACGRRATGGGLTNSEIAAISKLKRMKHTSAIRWESGGRVIGEYWTQATGTRHKTTNSIEKAVAWLVSEGRL
jgi:hypothetical protein